MTVEEKVAIQNLVISRLQADAEAHPTSLLDALLSGDGIALVFAIVAQEEAQARQRSEILTRLLAGLKGQQFYRAATSSAPAAGPEPPATPSMAYLPPEGRR